MIVDDFIEPAVLTGFVREVPAPAELMLNRFLPDRFVPDIEAAFDQVTRVNRAASFRSWDAETAVTERDRFQRSRVKLPPLGIKSVLGEQERLMLERIRTGGDNRNGYVDAIYDDAANNTRYVYNRMELARGDVLTDWKFTLTGEGGLTLEANFGAPAGHTVTAGTVWSDAANASPLTDLKAWVKTYVDANGVRPAYMLTSSTVISNLLLSQEIRELAGSLAGVPSLVTEDQLNRILQAHRLPVLVEYDTRIDVDDVDTRVIAEDRVIFLPADPSSLGYTAWGITAEALELAAGQNPSLEFTQLPGLVGVVLKEGDPLRVWTKVGAVGMPLITNPRRLMVADVL
ncbi:major capsid protein [Micromonospora sp. C51]|uniref:major capsid protein n=1 Tax=Micromonospora sp. C51 TaxID=2824879 RepID=UPI001B358843|nr:major capsid protein [Micromonospora sp. C51]MBQ1047861.1 major capsid protein [Micromonospora sp. C51]